jgi:small membrane protein
VLIRIFLIIAAVGLLIVLLRSRTSARTRAWKKLIVIALTGIAILSILRPELTGRAANFVGVGRGTDLLLYLLTAIFLYVAVGFFLRFRDVERQLTVLARRLALDEAAAAARSGDRPLPPEVTQA